MLTSGTKFTSLPPFRSSRLWGIYFVFHSHYLIHFVFHALWDIYADKHYTVLHRVQRIVHQEMVCGTFYILCIYCQNSFDNTFHSLMPPTWLRTNYSVAGAEFVCCPALISNFLTLPINVPFHCLLTWFLYQHLCHRGQKRSFRERCWSAQFFLQRGVATPWWYIKITWIWFTSALIFSNLTHFRMMWNYLPHENVYPFRMWFFVSSCPHLCAFQAHVFSSLFFF